MGTIIKGDVHIHTYSPFVSSSAVDYGSKSGQT